MQQGSGIVAEDGLDDQEGQEDERPIKAKILGGQPEREKVEVFDEADMEQVVK
jgi:hypothetical protein